MDETHEERARRVSESLHEWCKSQGVRIIVADDSASVLDDQAALFDFRGMGYEEHTVDEITVVW